jgi:hypothetical protein
MTLYPRIPNKTSNVRNTETPLQNHCFRGKAVNITYSGCMRRIILSSVACCLSDSNLFLHIVINAHNSRQNVIEHQVCVLTFSTTFVWNISLSKKNWASYTNVYRASRTVPVLSVTFWWHLNLMKLEFPRQIFEKCLYIKFHKNPSSESRVMANIIVAFWNFANAPKKTVLR